MKEKGLLASNLLLILVLTHLASVVQISFFSSDQFLLRYLPTPLCWLSPVVFLSLYRAPLEGILSVYLLIYSLSPLTVQSTGSMLLSSLVLFSCCQSLKTRFFWPGVRYFMTINAVGALIFQASEATVHFIFDDYTPTLWQVASWFPRALITPVAAYALYFPLNMIDRITQKMPLTELRQESS